MAPEAVERQRVDKWLWQARFFKTRALAATVAESGKLRINGAHCQKAAQTIRPGDVLTFPQGARIRVIRIEAIGIRRGPAVEAATLYADLDPRPDAGETGDARPDDEPADAPPPAFGARAAGSGRPTKRERREIDAARRSRS